MTYALAREDALVILKEYVSSTGMIEFTRVREILLAEALRPDEVQWAYQKARQHRMLEACMPTDPRMAALLAMDT